MEELFVARPPILDKWLEPDGSVVSHDGLLYLPAESTRAVAFSACAAIPNKYLKSDGSVISGHGTASIVLPANTARAAQWHASTAKTAKWLKPNGDLVDEMGSAISSLGDAGKASYDAGEWTQDKFLNQDGSITQMDGTTISEGSQELAKLYEASAPIADKWINSLGDIISIIGVEGGDEEYIGDEIELSPSQTVDTLTLDGSTIEAGNNSTTRAFTNHSVLSPTSGSLVSGVGIKSGFLSRSVPTNAAGSARIQNGHSGAELFSAITANNTSGTQYPLILDEYVDVTPTVGDTWWYEILKTNAANGTAVGGYHVAIRPYAGSNPTRAAVQTSSIYPNTPIGATQRASLTITQADIDAGVNRLRIYIEVAITAAEAVGNEMRLMCYTNLGGTPSTDINYSSVNNAELYAVNDVVDTINETGAVTQNFDFYRFTGAENFQGTTNRFNLNHADWLSLGNSALMPLPNSNNDLANIICSDFNTTSWQAQNVSASAFGVAQQYSSRALYFRWANDGSTLQDWKDALVAKYTSNLPMEIVAGVNAPVSTTVNTLDITQIPAGSTIVASGNMMAVAS